jgi:hypothetical protein
VRIYGPAWLHFLSDEEKSKLANGEPIMRDGKIYAVCAKCSSVVRVDKPIFGGMHFCN